MALNLPTAAGSLVCTTTTPGDWYSVAATLGSPSAAMASVMREPKVKSSSLTLRERSCCWTRERE